MRVSLFMLAPVLAIGACDFDPTGKSADADGLSKPAASNAQDGDPLAARDPGEGQQAPAADDKPRPVMQAQVVLDRLGFTPGVVDGKEGLSTRNALMGFQEAQGLTASGKLDEPTKQALARWSNIPATRVVTIPADFAAGPFQPLPEEPEDQAKLTTLAYETLDEKLAERFHTTIETLKELNPQLAAAGTPAASPSATPTPTPSAKSPSPTASAAPEPSFFQAGQQVRVPNVGGDQIPQGSVKDASWQQTLTMLGVGSQQPKAARIVVSKSKGTLKVYDASDKIVGMYTATMGSGRDPLPLGNWKITGVSYNPPFHYNPELFWDVPDDKEKQRLPPGPNGPVGVAWIDLSKEHYGIHGTPEPQTIGRAQSHGCVRLTNWDVARLAQMVSSSTKVLFEA